MLVPPTTPGAKVNRMMLLFMLMNQVLNIRLLDQLLALLLRALDHLGLTLLTHQH